MDEHLGRVHMGPRSECREVSDNYQVCRPVDDMSKYERDGVTIELGPSRLLRHNLGSILLSLDTFNNEINEYHMPPHREPEST